jgi:hypothetical protein
MIGRAEILISFLHGTTLLPSALRVKLYASIQAYQTHSLASCLRWPFWWMNVTEQSENSMTNYSHVFKESLILLFKIMFN